MIQNKKIYLLVAAVGVLSIAIRLWMLDKHWINPDEGAHLMDAILALSGKVPMIDYDSRQPLYTYSLAAVLHLFGHGFETGRLLSCICSFMTGIMVFFLGKVLFDEKTAAVGAVIYYFLPLEFMNSTMVKTEPLTTLLTCISFLSLSLAHRSEHNTWLILSGATAALCFYVRQSAIIIPAAAVIVFISGIFIHPTGKRIRPILYFIFGYAATVLLITLLYLGVAGFNQKIISELNPFGFVYLTLKKGLAILLESMGLLQTDSTAQATSQFPTKYPLYWRYIKEAISMHLFLIIGAGGVLIDMVARKSRIFDNVLKYKFSSCALLFVWLSLMVTAYAYFLYVKGFHIDYFREFLPPLTLLFAAWLRFTFFNHQAAERTKTLFVIAVFVLLCLPVLHALQPARFGLGTVTALGMAVFTMIYYAPRKDIKRKKQFFLGVLLLTVLICIPGIINMPAYFSITLLRFICLLAMIVLPLLYMEKQLEKKTGMNYRAIACTVMAGAIVFGISASVKVVDWAYTAPWPPKNVYDVAAIITTHTSIEDRVLSGAAIWEFQSNRRPFLDITHPLTLTKKMENSEHRRIEQNLESNDPEVIVLDGYTEKTYLKQFPWLKHHIDSAYTRVHRVEGGKYPVEIYMKN